MSEKKFDWTLFLGYMTILLLIAVAATWSVINLHKHTVATNPVPRYSSAPAMNEVVLPAEHPSIVKLRQFARQRHVYWQIYCSVSDDGMFTAESFHNRGEDEAYIESGGKPFWYLRQAGNTQAIAAERLMRLMDSPENFIPTHKPGEMNHDEHHECPPPLSGGPQ